MAELGAVPFLVFPKIAAFLCNTALLTFRLKKNQLIEFCIAGSYRWHTIFKQVQILRVIFQINVNKSSGNFEHKSLFKLRNRQIFLH